MGFQFSTGRRVGSPGPGPNVVQKMPCGCTPAATARAAKLRMKPGFGLSRVSRKFLSTFFGAAKEGRDQADGLGDAADGLGDAVDEDGDRGDGLGDAADEDGDRGDDQIDENVDVQTFEGCSRRCGGCSRRCGG